MNEFSNTLQDLQQRMTAACARAGRAPDAVQLIAISKGVEARRMAAAATAGQSCFGESYLQEALPKIEATETLAARALDWHFIGPVQANKTGAIAAHFSWVHGVDREKIARRLAAARGAEQPLLKVCVQVNVSGEASKSGCVPEAAAGLCAAITRLPQLCLRGLMSIPAADADGASSRAAFRQLRQLADQIRASGAVRPAQFDTLSMGMSDDFEIAIEEGATLVRIGSALFGERP